MKLIGYPNSKTSYTELVGRANPGMSPVESFRQDFQRVQRKMLISWDGRQQAVKDILGTPGAPPSVFGGGGPGGMLRLTPAPYAAYSWTTQVGGKDQQAPYLWATGVDFEGYGVPPDRNMIGLGTAVPTNNEAARYWYARATVTYESLPYEVIADDAMVAQGWAVNGCPDEASLMRYVEKMFKASGRYLSAPAGSMYIVGTGKTAAQVGQSPGKIVADADVRLRHHNLAAASVQSFLVNRYLSAAVPGAIHTCLGTVNSADFPPSGLFAGCFPKASLLYVGCALTPMRSPLGGLAYTVEHAFNFTGVGGFGHNAVPTIDGSGNYSWVELCTTNTGAAIDDATGKHVYNAADHAKLFRTP